MKNERENWYVASLVVQIKPRALATVKQILTAQPGTEVHAEDQQAGKLVVIIESNQHSELVARMEAIQAMDGVIAVSLVYSHQDESQG